MMNKHRIRAVFLCALVALLAVCCVPQGRTASPQTIAVDPTNHELRLMIAELRGEVAALRAQVEVDGGVEPHRFGAANRTVAVPLSSLTNGYTVQYNSTTGLWDNVAMPAGGGTIAGIASTGAGTGIVANGVSGSNVQVKSLVAGSNVVLTNGTNDITIASTNPGGTIQGIASTGAGTGILANSTSGVNVQVKSLVAGANITLTNGANDVTIASTGGGFTPPTGTGFMTVTGGAMNAAALAYPLPIADGGTNATSYTSSSGVLRYNGTSVVNSANFTSDGSGNATLSSSLSLGSGTFPTTGRVKMTGAVGTDLVVWNDGTTDRQLISTAAADGIDIGDVSQGNQATLVGFQVRLKTLSNRAILEDGPMIGTGSVSSPWGVHGDVVIADAAGATHTLTSSEYVYDTVYLCNELTTHAQGSSGTGGTYEWPNPGGINKSYIKHVWNGCNGATAVKVSSVATTQALVASHLYTILFNRSGVFKIDDITSP